MILDIEVDVDEPEKNIALNQENSYCSKIEKKPKPITYKFTIVLGEYINCFRYLCNLLQQQI